MRRFDSSMMICDLFGCVKFSVFIVCVIIFLLCKLLCLCDICVLLFKVLIFFRIASMSAFKYFNFRSSVIAFVCFFVWFFIKNFFNIFCDIVCDFSIKFWCFLFKVFIKGVNCFKSFSSFSAFVEVVVVLFVFDFIVVIIVFIVVFGINCVLVNIDEYVGYWVFILVFVLLFRGVVVVASSVAFAYLW